MRPTFYWNNKVVTDFTELWTNTILLEKIKHLDLSYPCHIFVIRPEYEGDDPFEVIEFLDKKIKILLWYVDIAEKIILENHRDKIFYYKKLGFDLSVVVPDYNDYNFDLVCDVLNNYSMADCVLEQQLIERKNIGEFLVQSNYIYREKHFLSYNGTPKEHRLDLIQHILKSNIIDKFDISFNSFYWESDEKSRHLDLKKSSGYTSTILNLPIYFNSYIDLITTSKFEGDSVYIDEKIYKSFACHKPFILVGQANTLKLLRKYGFKTFDTIIDETYDEIVNDKLRFEMILDEVDRLITLDIKEVDELYRKLEPILTHNSYWLRKFINNTDNKIIKFLR